MKISPVKAELFHANGQTHRRADWETDRKTDKLIVAFRDFTNAP
jgi:hypothetical protein